jgi:hypothetical protein
LGGKSKHLVLGQARREGRDALFELLEVLVADHALRRDFDLPRLAGDGIALPLHVSDAWDLLLDGIALLERPVGREAEDAGR